MNNQGFSQGSDFPDVLQARLIFFIWNNIQCPGDGWFKIWDLLAHDQKGKKKESVSVKELFFIMQSAIDFPV